MLRSCPNPPTSDRAPKIAVIRDFTCGYSLGIDACGGRVARMRRHRAGQGRVRRRHDPISARPHRRPALAFPARRVHDGRTGPHRRGRFHGLGIDSDPPHGRPDRRGGVGQDDAGGGAAASGRRALQGRQRRAGQHRLRPRARGDRARHDPRALARPAAVVGSRRGRAHHHARRHPGASRLRRRRRHRTVGGGCRAGRRERGRRRHGGHAVRVGGRRGGGRSAHRRGHAGGQGACGLPPRAGRAAGGVRRGTVGAGAAARRGAGVPRDRRRAQRAGARVRRGRPPPRRSDAGRRRGRGAPDARRGDRGDRVARRRPARGVPRRERAVGLRARAHVRRRGRDGGGGARDRLLRRDRHRRRPRGRPALQPRARVRRPRQPHHRAAARTTATGGTELRVAPSPDGETLAPGVPHRGRPVRRAGVDVQGALGRRASERPAAQRHDRRRRAHPRAVPARGAEHLPVDALRAGDVGAVAKLTGSPSGSLLWTRANGTARPVAQAAPRAGVRGEPRARRRSPTTRS